MLRLILKIFVLFLAIFVFIKAAAFLCRRELDPNNYLAEIAAKHRLLESSRNASSSRLIFIGDSSLPFGFKSAIVAQALKQPVINMGLHAAFGLEFILKEIYPDVRPGDKVILVMHYYPSREDINDGVICHALDFYPDMYRRLNLNLLAQAKLRITCDLKRTRRFLINYPGQNTSSPAPDQNYFDYKLWALNGEGDFSDSLYQQPDPGFTLAPLPLPAFPQDETIKLLNDYQKKIKEQGAELWLAYPPYPQSSYEINEAAISDYDRMLREKTSIKILDKPADSVYEDKYFFNSDYHLISSGKLIYSNLIANLLKKELNIKP